MDLRCPGLYCGRLTFDNDTFSECGKCPLGYKSSIYKGVQASVCVVCPEFLDLYDWIYLVSIFFLQLVFEFYLIDYALKLRQLNLKSVVLYLSSLSEILISSLLSVYLFTGFNYYLPVCKSEKLKDWYTFLDNPIVNGKTLSCAKEFVYPLFTLPFVFFFFTSVFLLIFRPFLIKKMRIYDGAKTVYYTMYMIPILGLFHSIFSGIYYFSYPYFLFFLSLCSLSGYMASQPNQSVCGLLKILITNAKPFYVILGFWILHFLSLLAIIELKNFSMKFLFITPVPTFYYIFTSKYSEPKKK